MENLFDLGIIGGGPAGYSAAIRAAQKGLLLYCLKKTVWAVFVLTEDVYPQKLFCIVRMCIKV